MALPPNIPTSFVPKQPLATQPRRKPVNGLLYYASLVIAGVALVAAGITFGYQKYAESVRDAKKTKLEALEREISPEAVEEFIRLRNRIRASKALLDTHVYGSQFFEVLENITLQNVRFQSLMFSVADDRSAKIEMHGIARSFNALAAESAAFANEKRIKRAIFSDINSDKNGVVKFSLKADIDPKLLVKTSAQVAASPETPNISTTTDLGVPVQNPSTTPAVATTTATTTKATPAGAVKTGTTTKTTP